MFAAAELMAGAAVAPVAFALAALVAAAAAVTLPAFKAVAFEEGG